MSINKALGTAALAAAIFATGCSYGVSPRTQPVDMHASANSCSAVSSCKGQSSCKGKNGCGGK